MSLLPSLLPHRAGLELALWLALASQAGAQTTNWFAFNDHNLNSLPAPTTAPNVTLYHLGIGPGGPLTNQATGEQLAVTLIVTWTGGDGPDNFGASNDPNAGTPAYNLFNGIVDVGGSGAGVDEGIVGLRNSEENAVTLTFSNLNAGRKYAFRGTSVRGNSYNDRWAYYAIQGAASFVDAHVDGSANLNIFTVATFPGGTLTSGQVALNSGENRVGSLVGWDDIIPALDGTFSIVERQYIGAAPFGTPSAGPYGYGMSAIMLAEIETGPPTAPAITTQPAATTINERGVATLSVVATGTRLTYQWYVGAGAGTAIPGATRSTYVVTNRLGGAKYAWSNPSDSGTYHVVVTGSIAPPATSANAVLTVNADVTRPTLVRAVCSTNDEYIFTFSEPLNNDNQGMIDPFLWEIRSIDNLDAPLGNTAMNYVDNGVNTSLIITAAGRNPAKGYKIVHIDGTPVLDTAKTANELAAGATLPILCFTNELLALNASWRYNDTGAALGATWYTGPDSNFPSSGPGIFDAKRTNGIDIPPFCRPVIVPNPLPVGTCTTLSNTTTRVFVTNQFFRTHFNFSGNPAQVLLQMETYADDGAIVYLNGSVLQNLGMPTGPLNNVSLSTRGHDPDREVFLYAPAPLQVGDNVIAAQVGQQNADSSDITWGCRISVLQATPPVVRPRLFIVNSGANVIVSWTPALAATLKSSTSISAPVSSWTTVGTTSPQTVPRAGTQKFFILVP